MKPNSDATAPIQTNADKEPDLAHRIWRYYYRYFRAVRTYVRNLREQLDLWFYKIRGGDYLTWYAKRLDGYAKEQTIDNENIAEHIANKGEGDLELLIGLGLKPDHHLHEIGVGHGRSARWLVDYLEPGHYCGNDPSSARLEHARQFFEAAGVADKGATLITNLDNEMNWLDGRKFDYIFCNHVFTHMPQEDIEDLFSNVHHLMHDKTEFLFTYSEALGRPAYREGVKDWLHTMAFYDSLAVANKMTAENLTEEIQALGDKMKVTQHTRLVRVMLRTDGDATP